MKKMKPDTIRMCQIFKNGLEGPWFYRNLLTGSVRKRWWTKARVPGTVRKSRLPGGSGYRNREVSNG